MVCQRKGDEHPANLARVKAYVEETVEQIQHYLGLGLTISEITLRDGLIDFAGECAHA